MKLMIIKNNNSSNFVIGFFSWLLKQDVYENCSRTLVMELLAKENPGFVYTNFFEPVNGDNDVVTMLSSIDVNTRLRVIIINSELVKNLIKETFKNFILPGKNQHKLDTP